jgi:pimeloyl-ACP methyl ester carboxylesterase
LPLRNESFAVNNGLAIYSFGEGPPLLLMPYPLGAFVIGDPIPDALVGCLDRWRVLTFDPRGVGRSVRAPRLSLEEMTECAIEVLDAFGITEAVPVIGHSQGAMAAMYLAYTRPARVESLILVSAASSAESYLSAPGAIWKSAGFLLRAGLYAATRRRATQRLLFRHVVRQSFVDAALA